MKVYLALAAVTFLAFFLRFYQLDQVPVGFHIDEVAIGYNGWTIARDGKDEWGTSWPVLFKSFGDYKAPGMIYATALSQKIFGHNEWAVRFPSALAGVLVVVVLFYLILELTKSYQLSAISSFLLAISPWHLQFSRLAFEGSLALFFTILATYLFIVGVRKNIWLLVLSLFFFALAVMTYHAEKIFVPLFLGTLFLTYRHRLLTKHGLAAVLIGGLFFLPYLPTYFSKEGRARAVSESIFNQKEPALKLFQENFVASFSLDYLFFRGDQNGRHSVKKLGELYVWQLPFVIVGVFVLIRKYRLAAIIIFSWLLLAALPPAIVRPSPHAYRNFLAVPMWQVITAVGLFVISQKMGRYTRLTRFCNSIWQTKSIRRVYTPLSLFFQIGVSGVYKIFFAVVLVTVIAHSLTVYLDWYYSHAPRMFGPDFNDGYREAALYLKSQEKFFDKIVVEKSLPEVYLKFYGNDLPQYQYLKDQVKYPEKTLGLMPVWMVSADNPKIVRTIKQKSGDPIFYAYKY